MGRRRVCVVLVDRANYGRLKPVMKGIAARHELELQVLVAGSMVLERFQEPVSVIKSDGLPVHGEVHMEVEGSNPLTMAKSVGLGIIEFAGEFQKLKPDIVLLIGDRYEMLAAAIAAAYMNICIAHIQGGEVSGSIDESARHAISKFAQFHFPSTKRSAEYLIRMGERPDTILEVGCPSSDLARELDKTLTSEILNSRGNGAILDPAQPFLLVVFHPITTEFGSESQQMEAVLDALNRIQVQTLLLWPNIDAGAHRISKQIRRFRDRHRPTWLRTQTNLAPENYLKVLANTACAVGNSSSFVRDASYFGTPVILVGSRQDGRECDSHVCAVEAVADQICDALQRQLANGRYAPSTLYGEGNVAGRICEALVRLEPYTQKRLHFVHDECQNS